MAKGKHRDNTWKPQVPSSENGVTNFASLRAYILKGHPPGFNIAIKREAWVKVEKSLRNMFPANFRNRQGDSVIHVLGHSVWIKNESMK